MVFNSSGVNVSQYIELSTREMAWYNYLIPFYINICEKCKDDNFNFSFMFFLFNVRYIGNYELSFNINFYQMSVGNVVEEAFGKQYTLKGKALSEPTAN